MKLAFYFVGINFDARKRNPLESGLPRGRYAMIYSYLLGSYLPSTPNT
jgi:hypothetical protein